MRNLSGEGQTDTPDNSINTSPCTERHHVLLLKPNEIKTHYLLCILSTLSTRHIHIYTNQKAENRWCRQGMKSGAGTMGLIMTRHIQDQSQLLSYLSLTFPFMYFQKRL